MIEVIKCINNNFPNQRTDRICSSIVGRTAAWYNKLGRTDVVFIEKGTFKDKKWLAKNKITSFPTLLFYKDGELSSGVIAEEFEQVAPELVLDGEYKYVAYGNTVGYLIEAIKELKNKIEELKSKKNCECK